MQVNKTYLRVGEIFSSKINKFAEEAKIASQKSSGDFGIH